MSPARFPEVVMVVSRLWVGREVANGCKNQSTNREIFSVGALLDDRIGLPGLPGLCVLGKRWNLATRVVWNQEIPSVFINLPIRVYKAVYFDYQPRGGVRVKFCVVGVVTELSLSFIDVVFLAENDTADRLSAGLITTSLRCRSLRRSILSLDIGSWYTF